MLGPYDLPPAFYGDKRGSQLLDWELRTRSRSQVKTISEEHLDTLLFEAENQRRLNGLPHGASWASRLYTNAQDWLDDVRCRLHSMGFGQPCPEAAS